MVKKRRGCEKNMNLFKIIRLVGLPLVMIVVMFFVFTSVNESVIEKQDSVNKLGDYNYLGKIESFELTFTGVVRTCNVLTENGNYSGSLVDCEGLEIGKDFCEVNVYSEGVGALTGIQYMESRNRICEVSEKWKGEVKKQ